MIAFDGSLGFLPGGMLPFFLATDVFWNLDYADEVHNCAKDIRDGEHSSTLTVDFFGPPTVVFRAVLKYSDLKDVKVIVRKGPPQVLLFI